MHSRIRLETRLSAKGQVVIPKAIRERLGWTAGTQLEVIAHAGGVTLRALPMREGPTVAEVLERIWARSPYHGPKLTDEDMDAAVLEMAARKHRPE